MCQFDGIPAWLLGPNQQPVTLAKQRLNFLRKTIRHISQVFNDEIYFSTTAGLSGIFQLLDPRVKLIFTVLFITLINLTQSFSLILAILALTLIYAQLSSIPLGRLLQRSWTVVPLLVLLCSIPALLNVVVPGKPLLELANPNPGHFWWPHGLYISDNGLLVVLKLFLKSGCSLSLGYLLLTTTRWNDLTLGLAKLKIPAGFILILDMTYRYIFLLANIGLQMSEARFMRTVGHLSQRENRRFLGLSIAVLFIKSNYLATEIFTAMRCRGFRHKIVSLKTLKLSKLDYIFLINNLLILLILCTWSKL